MTTHPLTTHRGQRGTALLASLMMVTIIAGAGAFVVQSHATFERRQALSIDRKRALYVAEAGLAEAVLAISQGRNGALGTEEIPVLFHDGIYWVDSESFADGRRLLTSRARVGIGGFTLRQTVRPNVNAIADSGFFGEDEVVIGDAVLMDGFNGKTADYSDLAVGGYGLPTSGDGALVRSNGPITIQDASAWPFGVLDPYAAHVAALPLATRLRLTAIDPSSAVRLTLSLLNLIPLETKILGELRPGYGEALLTNGNSELKELVPAERKYATPVMLRPQTVREIGGASLAVNGYMNFGQVSARAGKVVVSGTGELVLEGPAVLHLNWLVIEPGGMLRLDDRLGPIHLHVENLLQLEAGSLIVSVGGQEPNFGTTIFVEPGDGVTPRDPITFASSGIFRGLFYAPGHDLILTTGMRYIGAASAKRLLIKDGAWVTYDRALLTNGAGVPAIPHQEGWQILAEEAGTTPPLGFDPIADLQRRGITPLAPTAASLERSGKVEYLDAAGLMQTFTGIITGPVLASMERVVTIAWLDPVTSAYGPDLRPAGLDPDGLIEANRIKIRADR